MNNLMIGRFAKNIGENNSISQKNVKAILSKLSAKDLRTLFRELKKESLKNTVTITASEKMSQEIKKDISRMFQNKTMLFKEDKTIGAGIRIKTYDMIYDLSLSGKIKRIAENLE